MVTTRPAFTNVTVQRKSVGNVAYEKPVFCENGKSLAIPSGPTCHLYSTSTGDYVRELFTCNDNIIAIQLHPENSSEIIAITEKGEVTVCNLQTNEIQSSFYLILDPDVLQQLHIPKFDGVKTDVARLDYNKKVIWKNENLDEVKFLHGFVDCFKKIKKLVVFATWCLKDENHSHISAFEFDGNFVSGIRFSKTALKKCGRNFVVGTYNKQKILVGMSTTAVTVVHFTDEERFSKETIKFTKFLTAPQLENTCIAFHPIECSFATGDSLGRVYVWRNILQSSPLKDEYHWHYLPVRDLAFTAYGSHLFSGGEETVLVKWSLSSQHKTHLPRLTSAICHIQIAPESSTLAISTQDNRILITSGEFNNISTIENFSRWCGLGISSSPNIFSVDPKTGAFVLNGRTGHVQFLTPKDNGRLLYSVDITNRNFITRDRNQTIINTEVTHCKFSKTGQWMITAEARKEETVVECRLKFWEFNDLKQEFSLNTNIELPHENSEILSLEISSEDVVATTGNDKKFKMWALFEAQQLNQTKQIWSILNVGTYRMLPCSAVDFSNDASLIAVSFDQILTIWETDNFNLKCSLSPPLKRDRIKFLKFGNNELSSYVVTATDYNLSSWDVIKLTMMWTVHLKVSLLIKDPFSKYMSAFSVKNGLFIFEPSSPNKVFSKEDVSDSSVISANFVVNSRTGSHSQLYFLNADQELLYLENEGEEVFSAENESGGSRKLTPFAALIPESSKSNVVKKKKAPLIYGKLASENMSLLLESPSHTLPNPSRFCMDILKSLSLTAGKPAQINEDSVNDEVTILENIPSENAVESENLVDEEDLLKIKNSLFS